MSTFIGESVLFRFVSISNSSLRSDGFYFDDFQIVDYAEAPLPVELTSFEGEIIGSKTHRLWWETATESGNDFFEIQRSRDGSEWGVIGQLTGQGNSSQSTNYEFFDRDPLLGANYYRLRQVDFSGEFALSNVILLNQTAGDGPSPNPFRSQLLLPLASANATFKLFDIQGREWTSSLAKEWVDDQYIVNTQRLPNGLYWVRYEGHAYLLVKQ